MNSSAITMTENDVNFFFLLLITYEWGSSPRQRQSKRDFVDNWIILYILQFIYILFRIQILIVSNRKLRYKKKEKEKLCTISVIYFEIKERTIAFLQLRSCQYLRSRIPFSSGHRNKNDYLTSCSILIHSLCFEIIEIKGEDSFSATSKLSIFTFQEYLSRATIIRMINLTSCSILYISVSSKSDTRVCNMKTLKFLLSRIFFANLFIYLFILDNSNSMRKRAFYYICLIKKIIYFIY